MLPKIQKRDTEHCGLQQGRNGNTEIPSERAYSQSPILSAASFLGNLEKYPRVPNYVSSSLYKERFWLPLLPGFHPCFQPARPNTVKYRIIIGLWAAQPAMA
jgi:hypothetical protein